MADLSHVDIRSVLSTLRPDSEYHWKGDGAFGNQYDAIGEWRDKRNTKPTEQDVLDAWPAVEAMRNAAKTEQRKRQRLIRELHTADSVEGLAVLFEMVDYLAKGGLFATLPDAKKAQWSKWIQRAGKIRQVVEG